MDDYNWLQGTTRLDLLVASKIPGTNEYKNMHTHIMQIKIVGAPAYFLGGLSDMTVLHIDSHGTRCMEICISMVHLEALERWYQYQQGDASTHMHMHLRCQHVK